MNIKSAIIIGKNILKDQYIQTAQLDTEILMAKAIDEDRKYIILNDQKNLKDTNLKYFEKLIKERASRKPIAYLVEQKFFWNSEFTVTNDTLIPRPDTELLVESILKLTKNKNKMNILDVGVGGAFSQPHENELIFGIDPIIDSEIELQRYFEGTNIGSNKISEGNGFLETYKIVTEVPARLLNNCHPNDTALQNKMQTR